MKSKFEDYLEQQFLEQYPGTLDDDISDRFDGWLGNLDAEDYIKYGESYGRQLIEKVINDIPYYDERGMDIALTVRELKNNLRANWLGNQN